MTYLEKRLKRILKKDEEFIWANQILDLPSTKIPIYIFTTHRIIIDNTPHNFHVREFDYKDIYGFAPINNRLYIIDKKIHINHSDTEATGYYSVYPSLNIGSPIGVLRKIEKHWLYKSPYSHRIRWAEKTAEKYKLKLNPLGTGRREIIIKGIIDNINIQFLLRDIFIPDTIQIKLEIPNPEKIFFSLSPENTVRKLGKLFGLQDVILGNKKFDSEYLIQSNYPERLPFLFDENLMNDILKYNHNLKGDILFGEKEKLYKRKNIDKEELELLDAYLVDQLPDVPLREKENRSEMIFAVHRKSGSDTPEIITRNALGLLETFIHLAAKITK